MSRSGGMDPLALFFSASGRITPKPFATGGGVVYALIFLSELRPRALGIMIVNLRPLLIAFGFPTWVATCPRSAVPAPAPS